jgi:glycosyltransferase involved in cell wall biosynthesis
VRIAIVAPPWVPVPPPAYGGTETVLDTLARGLEAAGHDVLLYATGDSTCPVTVQATYDRALGVGVGGVAAETRHVVDAYAAAARFGADIVHDHTLTGPLLADRLATVPVVTTNHGPFDAELTAVYRLVATRVPVVAISHRQAATAGDVPVAAVIHHGVDLDRFPVGRGGDHAVFLGRMNPTKGVARAIRIARAAGVPIRVAAKMREPAEVDYFRAEVAPLLGPDAEYLGEVGGADKLALLAEARCLLNPIAWDEPFGMVMIEALATGTPVVATPRGAAPEIVDHGTTGFLHGSDAALARAVQQATQLSRDACRRTVKERFSASRLASDHVALYERVLGRHHGEAAA